MTTITVTSDFGSSDGYVGVMKGVMREICPEAVIVDLSNEIAPGDIKAAAWILHNSYRYFPLGTVHLSVVDPGVGSNRRAILVYSERHAFVGPDNGIFSLVLNDADVWKAHVLERSEYFRPSISTTFHGRDIFAPVAAHLASGEDPSAFGAKLALEDLVRFRLPGAARIAGRVVGAVVYIDRFGNVITNIDEELLGEAKLCRVAGVEVLIGSTYADSKPGEFVACLGSHGCLEIAVNGGRADIALSVAYGTEVVAQ
jgi:S-adenosylmethionine hydrolase